MPTQTTSSRSRRATGSPARTPSRSSARTAQGDSIFDLLIADHRLVAAVFDELKAAIEEDEPDAGACLELLAKIDALLTPHARAEERVIYPAFAQSGDDARLPVAEAFEEHALVHQLVAELEELDEVDETWCAKAKVMMDLVEHHVREEEGEQFREARKGLSREDAVDLGAQFEAAKLELAEELGLPAPEELELPSPKRRPPAKN